MYSRICLAASDLCIRRRSRRCRRGRVVDRRSFPKFVQHGLDACDRCARLSLRIREAYAPHRLSRADFVEAANLQAADDSGDFGENEKCCEDRCSLRTVDQNFANYALYTEWRAAMDDPAECDAATDRLLCSIARYNRLPATEHCYYFSSQPNPSCMVCCRAHGECMCYCRRVILPSSQPSPQQQQSTAAVHHPRMRSFVAGNVVARVYTFWNGIFAYYEPRFMLHLARLGFVLTEPNCIRCTECLFLVSFWDMFCLFHYSGIVRAGENTAWQERLLRHLYSKRDLANIVRRFSHNTQKRDELVAGLRTLTEWHAQLHPACSNVVHTERYASLMSTRPMRTGGAAACHGTAARASSSIPRFLAARQLGF